MEASAKTNARRKAAKAAKSAAERSAVAAIHEERLRTAVPHDVADDLLHNVCSFESLVSFFSRCGEHVRTEDGDVECVFLYARGEFDTSWCTDSSSQGEDNIMVAAAKMVGLLQ